MFERTNIGYNYDNLIRKNLFNGLSDCPEIRLVMIPAFGGETVVNIEFDRDNNKYYMKNIIHKEIGWYTISKRKLHKYNKEISEESVRQIKKLYTTAINKVQ